QRPRPGMAHADHPAAHHRYVGGGHDPLRTAGTGRGGHCPGTARHVPRHPRRGPRPYRRTPADRGGPGLQDRALRGAHRLHPRPVARQRRIVKGFPRMTTPAPLPSIPMGPEGIRVGIQGLGCMGMSEFYGPTDRAEARATLNRALELGITLFDTADIYGSGDNEEFIGDFVRTNREQVVLATKFAITRKPDDPHYRGIDNSPE